MKLTDEQIAAEHILDATGMWHWRGGQQFDPHDKSTHGQVVDVGVPLRPVPSVLLLGVSGVLLSPRVGLSCAHALKGRSRATVTPAGTHANGALNSCYFSAPDNPVRTVPVLSPAWRHAEDFRNDLAILVGENGTGFPGEGQDAVLGEATLRRGERLTIIGYPGSQYRDGKPVMVRTEGTFSHYNAGELVMNVTTGPGYSGAPVFNSEGALVGIVTSGWPGRTFAVDLRQHAGWLIEQQDKHDEPMVPASPSVMDRRGWTPVSAAIPQLDSDEVRLNDVGGLRIELVSDVDGDIIARYGGWIARQALPASGGVGVDAYRHTVTASWLDPARLRLHGEGHRWSLIAEAPKGVQHGEMTIWSGDREHPGPIHAALEAVFTETHKPGDSVTWTGIEAWL